MKLLPTFPEARNHIYFPYMVIGTTGIGLMILIVLGDIVLQAMHRHFVEGFKDLLGMSILVVGWFFYINALLWCRMFTDWLFGKVFRIK